LDINDDEYICTKYTLIVSTLYSCTGVQNAILDYCIKVIIEIS